MTFDDAIPREGQQALLRMAAEFYLGEEPLTMGMTDYGERFPQEKYRNSVKAKKLFPRYAAAGDPEGWVLSVNLGWLCRDGRLTDDRVTDECKYPDAITAMEYYHQWREKVLGWAMSLELGRFEYYPAVLRRVLPDGKVACYDLCPLDLSFDSLMALSPTDAGIATGIGGNPARERP